MTNAWVFSLLVSMSLALAAQSSEISVHDVNGRNVIRIHGELEFRDDKEFTKKALELDEAIVFLEGPGGNLIAGIEIGKAIRLKGFATVVLENNSCLSACALAWLGGQPRFATSISKIGFHGAWEHKGSGKETTAPGNALVGAYLHGLGLSDKAIWFATSAGPDEAEYLSFDRAEELGIAVIDLTGAAKTAELTQLAQPEAPPPNRPVGGVYNDHTLSSPRQNPPPSVMLKTDTASPPAERGTLPVSPYVTGLLDLVVPSNAAQVQRQLIELRYLAGAADGTWGRRSRIALKSFRQANHLGSDDTWDRPTQESLFNGPALAGARSSMFQTNPAEPLVRFAPVSGASLHPLNFDDALQIQDALSRLGYYRSAGEGVWGAASQAALLAFKIANGLYPDESYSADVEQILRSSSAINANATPFGAWSADATSCQKPITIVLISPKTIAVGKMSCALDEPLKRAHDGWRGHGVCNLASVAVPVTVHLSLLNGRLIDRSQIGAASPNKPEILQRCREP